MSTTTIDTTATAQNTPATTDKPERSRPLPAVMLPNPEALAAIDDVVARTANMILQVVSEIDDIAHPIERSIAATSMMDALTNVLAECKDVRREAVKDAYEKGRMASGWYGYAALGSQIGLSASRVRQILFDISTNRAGEHSIRDTEADEIRSLADARREAIKMIKAGYSHDKVAVMTELDPEEIEKIALALHS